MTYFLLKKELSVSYAIEKLSVSKGNVFCRNIDF